MVDSRWADIYRHLKDTGFSVYPPATKKGECNEKYVVVKDAGTTDLNTISSTQALYDIIMYVPDNEYSSIDIYKDSIIEAMDKLFPMIRPVHFVTTPFHDDSVKAWMISMQYKNYRKKERA